MLKLKTDVKAEQCPTDNKKNINVSSSWIQVDVKNELAEAMKIKAWLKEPVTHARAFVWLIKEACLDAKK